MANKWITRIICSQLFFAISIIILLNPVHGNPMGEVGILLIEVGGLVIGTCILTGFIKTDDINLKKHWGWIPVFAVAIFLFVFAPMNAFSTDEVINKEINKEVTAVEHLGTAFFGDQQTIFHFNDGKKLSVDGHYSIETNKKYLITYETHTNLSGIRKIVSIEKEVN